MLLSRSPSIIREAKVQQSTAQPRPTSPPPTPTFSASTSQSNDLACQSLAAGALSWFQYVKLLKVALLHQVRSSALAAAEGAAGVITTPAYPSGSCRTQPFRCRPRKCASSTAPPIGVCSMWVRWLQSARVRISDRQLSWCDRAGRSSADCKPAPALHPAITAGYNTSPLHHIKLTILRRRLGLEKLVDFARASVAGLHRQPVHRRACILPRADLYAAALAIHCY